MNVNKPDDNGIKVSVALSEVPVRNAVVTLMGGTQSLTYGISATSLSDRGWQLLFLHGFPDINQPDGATPRTVFMSEPHEVREFRDRVATIIVTLTATLTQLKANSDFTGNDVTFLEFAARQVEEEQKLGNESRAEKYRSATARFKRFLKRHSRLDLLVRNLNAATVDAFNSELSLQGLKPSTIAFYNRILNALYNKAVRLSLTPDNAPCAAVPTQSPPATA